jgi:hypothetical protein
MEQPNVAETERLQSLYSRRVAASSQDQGSHATPEAILAVVQREGPEEERLATLEHVMCCATCHRDYEWLSAVDQAGAEAEGTTARAAGPWWRGAPLALAASMAVAVGAAVVLSNVLRSGPERERGPGGDIALITPGTTAEAGGPLTFTWRPVPGVSRYVLEVQGANGSIAFADTTADTSATLADPSRLAAGSAYRWWVREATEGTEPRSSAFRDLRLTGR